MNLPEYTTVSRWSEEAFECIKRAILKGATRQAQASAAGISMSALMAWLRKGRAGEEPYKQLAEFDIEHKFEWQLRCLETINRVREEGDDRTALAAATWMLERRDPNHFGRRDQAAIEAAARRMLVQLLRGSGLTEDQAFAMLTAAGLADSSRMLPASDHSAHNGVSAEPPKPGSTSG